MSSKERIDTRGYQVKEVARLTGVTVRTLHHYDEIGLLVPSERTGAGYRLYGDEDMLRLQQILIGRELGMSLEMIRRMLDEPGFDRRVALLEQRDQLRERGRRVDAMLASVDAALRSLEGDETVDMKELFDGFDPAEHEEEARTRWGRTDAYEESRRRTKSYRKEDWQRFKAEARVLMDRLAEVFRSGADPASEAAMDIAEAHRLHIDRWFYPLSHQAHVGLAGMYVADPRFKATYEKVATGLAEYFALVIRANAARGRVEDLTK